MVRDCVIAGELSFGPHFWFHAQTGAFGFTQIREVILDGQPIEPLADRRGSCSLLGYVTTPGI